MATFLLALLALCFAFAATVNAVTDHPLATAAFGILALGAALGAWVVDE